MKNSALFALAAFQGLLSLAPGLQAQSPASRSALDAAPAGVPLPALPSTERSEPYTAPAGVRLERNAALAERFTAPGQSVRYPFAARAGELSIFELAATGFARGWTAAAVLRVLDAAGVPLAEQRLEGGVQFRPLLAFAAPADGEYQLEVAAEREYFRFQLVRHSDYVARTPQAAPLPVERERLHGWLAGGGDRARYLVAVRAWEELVLRVEGTREEAREERRESRANAAGGAMGAAAMVSMASGRSMDRRGGAAIFPELQLELGSRADLLAEGQAFARLRAAVDGQVEVVVGGAPGSQAALFDLVIERAPATVAVAGTVIDANDAVSPLSELVFLREPDLDPWARTTTDDQGRYAVALPKGKWRIRLQRPGGGASELRAGFEADTIDRDLLFPES